MTAGASGYPTSVEAGRDRDDEVLVGELSEDLDNVSRQKGLEETAPVDLEPVERDDRDRGDRRTPG